MPQGATLDKHPLVPPAPVDGYEGMNLSRTGNLLFGGQPDETTLRKLRTELEIDLDITLRAQEEQNTIGYNEEGMAHKLGMGFINIPVARDRVQLASVEHLESTLGGTQGPALVHCGSGDRVGALWAAFLALKRGVPIDQAISMGRAAGLRSEKLEASVRSLVSGEG